MSNPIATTDDQGVDDAPQTHPDILAARRHRGNHWLTWIENHAYMRPDETAFRFLGQSVSWRSVHERSIALADAFHRRGVRPGDRVLLLTLNRPEFFEAVFAANHLGAMAVPVNFRLTPPELAYIIRDSGARVAVTETVLAPLLGAARASAPALTTVIEMTATPDGIGPATGDNEVFDALIDEEGETRPELIIDSEQPALILYTSGTTGRPKGAVLTHANMVAQSITCIQAMEYTGSADIGCLASPVFHVAALGSLAPAFMLGMTTVILPLKEFNSTEMLDLWEREKVTVAFLVPVMWQAVCADPTLAGRDLRLRVISWGAAPASDTVLRQMGEKFPEALNVAVFGQTEMSPITCVLQGRDALRKLGSVGKVIPTIQARVVDGFGEDVPVGEVGEIIYRGPTMMLGYWGNPEATSEAFEGGWFHSGDLVRQDEEGFVYIVDRKKDMIISGGENIYCAEVENALSGHPGILEAAVIGRPDPEWGEVPVAVVVPRPGAPEPTLPEIRAFLDDCLARYKQPKDLVVLDVLPRNASGKIVKGVLRSDVVDGA